MIAVYLVRVDLPSACFGFEVDQDGTITFAAPIARWTLGKRGREVVAYYRKRGGEVTWTKAGQEQPAPQASTAPRCTTHPEQAMTIHPRRWGWICPVCRAAGQASPQPTAFVPLP